MKKIYCETNEVEMTDDDAIRATCDERGLDYNEARSGYDEYCESCNRQGQGYPTFDDYLDCDN